MKALIHDNYRIMDSLIRPYKHDEKAILERSKNDYNEQESFLSCTALNFKHLASFFAKKVIRASSQVTVIAAENPKDYRVSSIALSSFSAKKTLIDGVCGPSETPFYILGIDPGIKGAIAVLKDGRFVAVYDIPTYNLKVADKQRKKLDLHALSFLLDSYSNSKIIALIEDVASMPSDGHVGAFSFGFSTGAIHGAVTMAGIKLEKVKPQVWKSSMGLDSDKAQSIKLAIKLFPEASKYLKRKMDDGRAEAILIAWFAWKHLKVKA